MSNQDDTKKLHDSISALSCELSEVYSKLETTMQLHKEVATIAMSLEQKANRYQKLDAQAAAHVESVICMRSTYFTGEQEYVGWKGLGKALREDYDELYKLRIENNKLKELLKPFSELGKQMSNDSYAYPMDDERQYVIVAPCGEEDNLHNIKIKDFINAFDYFYKK